MSYESNERVLSTREQIMKKGAELLSETADHSRILSEMEDMIEDRYGYAEIVEAVDSILENGTLTENERADYLKQQKYCQTVLSMNGND